VDWVFGWFLLNAGTLCSGNGDETYWGSLDNYFVCPVVFEAYVSLLFLLCQLIDLDSDDGSGVFLQDLFCLTMWHFHFVFAEWPFYFIFVEWDLWDRLVNVVIWGIPEAVPLDKLLKAVSGVCSLASCTVEFLQDIRSFV